MDADFKPNHYAWFLRMSEQALRAVAMGLVLTGQMLPAGAVSAQDDPPSPSFTAPPAKPASGLTPVAVESPAVEEEAAPPVEAEENTAAPHPEEVTEETLPPAAEPAVAPPVAELPATEESPTEASSTEDHPAAEPAATPEAVPTPAEAAPEPAATEAPVPEVAPAPAPSVASEEAPAPTPSEVEAEENAAPAVTTETSDPYKYQIGEWTMAIVPGPVPAKVVHEYRAPVSYEGAPMNQNNLSVPVNVNVNNMASQGWPWASPWSTPWANLNYWNSPTAAYLFQHPQPYWQLRQDFYHLRPFIRGL